MRKLPYYLILCFVSLIINVCNTHAQTTETTYLSKPSVLNLVYKKFGNIVTGQPNTPNAVGLISLDPIKGSMAFNGSLPLNSKTPDKGARISFLSFNLSGDLLSNNASVLFNGSKINTNAALDFQYHWGLKKGIAYTYYETDLILRDQKRKYNRSLLEIDSTNKIIDSGRLQRQIKAIEISNSVTTNTVHSLSTRIDRFLFSIDSLELLIVERNLEMESENNSRSILISNLKKEIEELISGPPIYHSQITSKKSKIDSLEIVIRTTTSVQPKLIGNFQVLQKKYADSIIKMDAVVSKSNMDMLRNNHKIDSINYILINKEMFEDIYAIEYYDKDDTRSFSLDTSLRVLGIRFWWVTLGSTVARKDFYTFHEGMTLSNQIQKQDLTNLKLDISINHYFEKTAPKKFSFYANFGASLLRDNNALLYKTTEISEERVFKNALGDTVRKIARKYNAYTDSIFNTQLTRVYANFYLIHPSKIFSLHIFPSVDSYWKGKTVFNLGIGCVASLKNKKASDPIINAELYVQMLNIGTKNNITGTNIRNAPQIGIRFSHPFNFIKTSL